MPDKEQANDDARSSQNEEEFSPFAVHQRHADDGHEEVQKGEQHIAPMGMQIGQATLQQDVCVVSNDRVDAGRRVTEKNGACQQERKDILSPQQGILDRLRHSS